MPVARKFHFTPPKKKVRRSARIAESKKVPEPEDQPILPHGILWRISVHAMSVSSAWLRGDDSDEWPMRLAKNLALVSRAFYMWTRPFVWHTVYVTDGPQAVSVLAGLLTSFRASPANLIRNLWVASGRWKTREATGEPFAGGHPLGKDSAAVSNELMVGKNVTNLAVDMALFAEGWFSKVGTKHAHPKQLLLLDSIDPLAAKAVSFERPLFQEVTHLLVEPPFERLLENITETPCPLTVFSSLTHLCVRFASDGDLVKVMTMVDRMMRSQGLQMLVVCLDAGINPVCSEGNVMLRAFLALARQEPRVFVLPYVWPMSREWEAILGKEPTVWVRAEQERARRAGQQTLVLANEEEDSESNISEESLPEEDWSKWHGIDNKIVMHARAQWEAQAADDDGVSESVDINSADEISDDDQSAPAPAQMMRIPSPDPAFVPSSEFIIIDDRWPRS